MSSATIDVLRGMVRKFKPEQEPVAGTAQAEVAAAPPGASQGPNWTTAMQGGPKKKFDRRPFIILFLIFFGSFSWLYILYNLSHGTEKTSTKPTDDAHLHEQGEPAAPALTPPPMAAGTGYGAFPQGAPAVPYGAPQAAPQQMMAPQSSYQASPYQTAPQTYGTPPAPQYMAPPAVAGDIQAGPSGMPIDPQLQASFTQAAAMNPNQAISAPRNYRHALGSSPFPTTMTGQGGQQAMMGQGNGQMMMQNATQPMMGQGNGQMMHNAAQPMMGQGNGMMMQNGAQQMMMGAATPAPRQRTFVSR